MGGSSQDYWGEAETGEGEINKQKNIQETYRAFPVQLRLLNNVGIILEC